MKKLLLLLLAPALLLAQKEVTCADGSVVVDTRTSPFQPNPCGSAPLEEPEDLAFFFVYGPPPENTLDNIANRVARAKYATNKEAFRGLITPPSSFMNVVEQYGPYNFGEPLFFATKYGQYVRWPEAPFVPCQASVSTAVLSPNLVVAQCHVRVIQAGYCLPNPHPYVPPWLQKINSEACEVEE